MNYNNLTYNQEFDDYGDTSAASCVTCGQSVASRVDARPSSYEPASVDILMQTLRDLTEGQQRLQWFAERTASDIDSPPLRAVQASLDRVYTQVLHAVRQSRRAHHGANARYLARPLADVFQWIESSASDWMEYLATIPERSSYPDGFNLPAYTFERNGLIQRVDSAEN